MPRRKLSREELFALVWEKPTSEIAKELGLSDVVIGKLCTKLQVPKPPRGYWARIARASRRSAARFTFSIPTIPTRRPKAASIIHRVDPPSCHQPMPVIA